MQIAIHESGETRKFSQRYSAMNNTKKPPSTTLTLKFNQSL